MTDKNLEAPITTLANILGEIDSLKEDFKDTLEDLAEQNNLTTKELSNLAKAYYDKSKFVKKLEEMQTTLDTLNSI